MLKQMLGRAGLGAQVRRGLSLHAASTPSRVRVAAAAGAGVAASLALAYGRWQSGS
jgi:hypothetical protein